MAQPAEVGEQLLIAADKKANTKPGFFSGLMGRSGTHACVARVVRHTYARGPAAAQ